ncbi:MAG TPA: hypothetical protein ENN88_02720, partial [Candidatus Coatesbacteria bacterium]|nr:hypothetical protein [Candidatus Coatesbacteria bacterium]
MYLCRECGAEFIAPLGGRCPACGVRVKPSWKVKRTEDTAPPPAAEGTEETVEFILETEDAPEATATATLSQSRRPSEPEQPVDGFPDTGVYGPPRDYGGPAPTAQRPRTTAIIALVIGITVLLGVAAVSFLLLSGDCLLKRVVEGITEVVETVKPLWRDRAAEMREAGYAPVAGLPPDLWPAAEMTLWLVAD